MGLLMELQRADELLCAVSDNRPDEVFILTVTLTKMDIPQPTVNSVHTQKNSHVLETLEESERQDKLLSVIIS